MATPEGAVKAAARKVLDRRKVYYAMPVQTGYGTNGLADFICCVPVAITPEMVGQTIGVFLHAESKRPGQCHKTRPGQDIQMKAVEEAAGLVLVFDSGEVLDLVLQELHGEPHEQVDKPTPTGRKRKSHPIDTGV